MAMTKDKKEGRRNEGFVVGSKFEELDTCLMDVSKSVCKLKIEVNPKIHYGTGFLLRYPIDGKHFTCLLSNEHIITEEYIENKVIMNVSYNYENKSILIKLDKNERYIRSFKDIGLDITLVEILNSDDIYEDYFLFPESNYLINDLKNKQIYIPQFPLGKKIKNARGLIKDINEYELTHLVSTEECSSGSPIFLNDSKKVIGIHKQSNNRSPDNYGDLIYPILNLIEEDIKKIKRVTNNTNELNIKIKDEPKKYWKNCAFILGSIIAIFMSMPIIFLPFEKILPNRNRKLYYPNGNIKYNGGLKNNKYEGKGILYYENGIIKYEGNFINNKCEGKGIFYYENGNKCYEGDFVNDKFEGKGILYDKNGNKFYEGNFFNGKYEGKGILYYGNENKLYEGNFVNDKFEGKGIYNKIYEGNFVKGKFVGKSDNINFSSSVLFFMIFFYFI